MKKIRIGCGAGCCKDRIEPAVEMLEKGNLDYIIFENLSEASFAGNQFSKIDGGQPGYNDMLEYRMRRVFRPAKEHGTKIVSNMGSADPVAAAEKVAEIARELGLYGLKIGVVLGDDIFSDIGRYIQCERWQYPGQTLEPLEKDLAFANVYLGGEPVAEALKNGADVVITGRIADPALFTGPLMHSFGWTVESPEMGQAVLVGHLLECCGQVTGGFYADPGYKDVPQMENIGFPIAEIGEDGDFVISKVEPSGGVISIDVCKEQLLYEIADPSCYKTPDAILDLSGVRFISEGENMVRATGAVTRGIPPTLKANVGYRCGYMATASVCYAGSNSLELAKLCADTIKKRMEITGIKYRDIRVDYMGYNSLGSSSISDSFTSGSHSEIILRMSIKTDAKEDAELFTWEFGYLYTNGPACSTTTATFVKPLYNVTSIFIPREDVSTTVRYLEA